METVLPVVIMTINYSHDIATALLAVSGAALWIISRSYAEVRGTANVFYFIEVYRGITRLAKYSLIWILAAGVPRIIFYREYEWASQAGDLQVVAIIIKHIVMFLLVGTGIYHWSRLARRVQKLKLQYGGLSC